MGWGIFVGVKGKRGYVNYFTFTFKKMKSYDNETLLLIPGKSPLEKHENLIGYPRRGTPEEVKTLQDFADEVIKLNLTEQ